MTWILIAYEILAGLYVLRDQGMYEPLTLLNKLILLAPLLALSCWAVVELVRSFRNKG